jgi:hypothetical protein
MTLMMIGMYNDPRGLTFRPFCTDEYLNIRARNVLSLQFGGSVYPSSTTCPRGRRRRPEAPGSTDRLLRRAPYVGTEPAFPSAPALCRARRRPFPECGRLVSCTPGFFLPVRVLSRLFRRLFLTALARSFHRRKLKFFGAMKALLAGGRFAEFLTKAKETEWVVYAKRPPFWRVSTYTCCCCGGRLSSNCMTSTEINRKRATTP